MHSEVLSEFEQYLATIPLNCYREELQMVKTVEQNLPRDLNPLPAIYDAFWVQKPTTFPTYDEFFEQWWRTHLEPLDAFIRKYFWGCSHDFVFLGFKARLYRTFISVLTQFHFAYSWVAYCELPLESSAEMDMMGIDGLVKCEDVTVALQVKKETYRPEARGAGRFAHRRRYANWTLEVPYTVAPVEELQNRIARARKEEIRERNTLLLLLAERWQRLLPNTFVVFQPEYPRLIEQLIRQHGQENCNDDIGWEEALQELRRWELLARD